MGSRVTAPAESRNAARPVVASAVRRVTAVAVVVEEVTYAAVEDVATDAVATVAASSVLAGIVGVGAQTADGPTCVMPTPDSWAMVLAVGRSWRYST